MAGERGARQPNVTHSVSLSTWRFKSHRNEGVPVRDQVPCWLCRLEGTREWESLICSCISMWGRASLLLPERSLHGGNATRVMVVSAGEEGDQQGTGGKTMTVLWLRFPQPLGRRWACLLWGQHGLRVEHLTYLLRKLQVLCLSRSFLGVSCRS